MLAIMLQKGMNEAVSFAWAAVSLATARQLAVDCSDGQMKRGGGREEDREAGGVDEGVKRPAERGRWKGEHGARDAGGNNAPGRCGRCRRGSVKER